MNDSLARHTAIVATLGPVSQTRSCIEGLVLAGVDVVRLSMVNGTRERHTNVVELIREIAAECGRKVRLLADLQSRKNRLGRFPGGRTEWRTGDEVVLTSRPCRSTAHRTWTIHSWGTSAVAPGTPVLIDDGSIVLTVKDADADEMRCVVVDGGAVTDGRGITIPGVSTSLPGLTERDADDLQFAQTLGVDMVALSFARSPADYRAVRDLAPDPTIIGKVEHPDAVRLLPAMAEAFDGLMVARGDLALEIPFEDVPVVQKRIIAECASRDKMSMVATQLLHSMRESTRPTRAEVSDVANAVLDGADALVLSAETGFGRHPVRAVQVLRQVIERAEQYRAESPDAAAAAAR